MIARLPRHCKTLLLLLALLAPYPLWAAEPPSSEVDNPTEKNAPQPPTLPAVTVEASGIDPLTGGSQLDREQIDKLPSRNGNTSDLLRLMPGVQMPEAADSSKTAGEITPEAVSIAGARPYDNNFLIDGIGNNSLLDPVFSSPDSIEDIPGHPQQFFLLQEVIQEIQVLNCNIPARFGSFTGGVVDVTTIDPRTTFSGTIKYSGTHTDWTSFHIPPGQQDAFETSNTADMQPRLVKQQAETLLHAPINDSSSMLFSYSIVDSKIPLYNLGTTENQHRRQENYFVKYKNLLDEETTFGLTGFYAPFSYNYFLKNTKNSRYTLDGGGYSVTGKLEKTSRFGETDLRLAYEKGYDDRSAPDNHYNWRNTDSKDWGPKTFSAEGGYGDIAKEEESLSAKLHQRFEPARLASTFHHLSAGTEAERVEAIYDRRTQTINYTVAQANSNVDCRGENGDCIDGEQFFWYKSIYPRDHASARMLQLDAYLEDRVTYKRLTLRPGVRFSWNDYQENLDGAPRLTVGYDLFGNEKTVLIAGANRYYGENLLTLKLASQKASYRTERRSTTLNPDNTPEPWSPLQRTAINMMRVTNLNTPYSDELSVGLRHKLFGGKLKIDYFEREGKDLIVVHTYDKDPVTNIRYQEWTNDGRSHHREADLSWSRIWKNHYLEINATWQESRGNSDSYKVSDAGFDELIWYEGNIGTRDELLTADYNRPFKAVLTYSTNLGDRFDFTNVTTYRSPYKSVKKLPDPYELPGGTTIDAYEDYTNDAALTFDWHLAYEVFRRKNKNLKLKLTFEILNVFNQKTNLGDSLNDYEIGRQFWLGARCDF